MMIHNLSWNQTQDLLIKSQTFRPTFKEIMWTHRQNQIKVSHGLATVGAVGAMGPMYFTLRLLPYPFLIRKNVPIYCWVDRESFPPGTRTRDFLQTYLVALTTRPWRLSGRLALSKRLKKDREIGLWKGFTLVNTCHLHMNE